jgi:hypothetical protein
LKNGGLKREGRAQTEKRGPSVSEAGNVIETHEHAGDFTEPQSVDRRRDVRQPTLVAVEYKFDLRLD